MAGIMDEDEINWITGEANIGIERICPGRHVKQHEWQTKWNYPFKLKYDYISDYECVFPHPINENQRDELQTSKQKGFGIPITNVAHFTEQVEEIKQSNGFLGGYKKINEDTGNDIGACLSWWSAIFDDNVVTDLRNHMKECLKQFAHSESDLEAVSQQFGTSNVFEPVDSVYGDAYFEYSIKDLVDYYKIYIDEEEVQYRILGTFLYKNEIMHAILVCSTEAGENRFSQYPLVEKQGSPPSKNVVTIDNEGNITWYPQATGTVIKRFKRFSVYPEFRRWEHVAFAFHMHDENDVFETPNLKKHLKDTKRNKYM